MWLAPTQNFSLYYVAIVMVAKGEWRSDSSSRCYFAIYFYPLYDADSILSQQKHNNDSRASKTNIYEYSLIPIVNRPPLPGWSFVSCSAAIFVK
jgi:hypothetical protein